MTKGMPIDKPIYGFNGEEFDTISKTQYLRARNYRPSAGRFITRDTYLGEIINPFSLNLYSYVLNNPVKYVDPSGNSFDEDMGGTGKGSSSTLSKPKQNHDTFSTDTNKYNVSKNTISPPSPSSSKSPYTTGVAAYKPSYTKSAENKQVTQAPTVPVPESIILISPTPLQPKPQAPTPRNLSGIKQSAEEVENEINKTCYGLINELTKGKFTSSLHNTTNLTDNQIKEISDVYEKNFKIYKDGTFELIPKYDYEAIKDELIKKGYDSNTIDWINTMRLGADNDMYFGDMAAIDYLNSQEEKKQFFDLWQQQIVNSQVNKYDNIANPEIEIEKVGNEVTRSDNAISVQDVVNQKNKQDAEIPRSGSEWEEKFKSEYGEDKVIRITADKSLDPVRNVINDNSDVVQPSLHKNSVPDLKLVNGKYPEINPYNPRGAIKEIKSADLLAADGMDVKLLPQEKNGNGYGIDIKSNPDYLIEGKVFDCYTADKGSLMKIRDGIGKKLGRQTNNIVLNLDYVNVEPETYIEYLQKQPMPGLEEIIIIKNNKYVQYKP